MTDWWRLQEERKALEQRANANEQRVRALERKVDLLLKENERLAAHLGRMFGALVHGRRA